jgi:hypothetical protein
MTDKPRISARQRLPTHAKRTNDMYLLEHTEPTIETMNSRYVSRLLYAYRLYLNALFSKSVISMIPS